MQLKNMHRLVVAPPLWKNVMLLQSGAESAHAVVLSPVSKSFVDLLSRASGISEACAT